LQLPSIARDQWSHIRLTGPYSSLPIQAGVYQLALYYNDTVGVTFWLDGENIFERTTTWSARSVVDDPWLSNWAPWTDFREFANSDTNGIRLYPQGKALQVRGQARRQDAAVLSAPKIIPQYAQLGRFTWPEDRPNTSYSYSLSISNTNTGRTYSFSVTPASSRPYGTYEWDFGDGTFAAGIAPSHTYQGAGSYVVGLTITDRLGVKTSVFKTITVT
jgi:PKD repeat protein